MKYLAIAIILTLTTLMACETEDPVKETSIIVDEGSTITVNTSTEKQSDEKLNPLDSIVQNLASGRGCYVGQTIQIKEDVKFWSAVRDNRDGWDLERLILGTDDNNFLIYINMFPIEHLIKCPLNYYKKGETYVFTILIKSIGAQKGKGWREGEPVSYTVFSDIVITEELEKELRKVDCEDEG